MDAWMKIGLAVGVMLFLGNNSTAVMLGYALSALFVTISQFLFLKRLIARQEESCYHGTNQNWVRQIWGFSWPFSTWGVFTWAQQVSDRWALDGFATTAEVGQYAVLFQLGYAPIGMLTGLMMMLVGPILYQRSGGAQDASRNISVHHIAWRITQVSFALTVAGFSVAWIFHDWLFRWLVAEAFRETSYLLPWVVLAGGLFAVGQMLALKLMSELCTSSLLTVKVVTALLGTAANVLGAWLYGLEGVVGGLVLFSAIYSAWMLTLAHRLPAAIPTND
jgi:O-antigen/teichoic acid export membrane protein